MQPSPWLKGSAPWSNDSGAIRAQGTRGPAVGVDIFMQVSTHVSPGEAVFLPGERLRGNERPAAKTQGRPRRGRAMSERYKLLWLIWLLQFVNYLDRV